MNNDFLIHEKFSPENITLNETIFHTSNGYIGIRGCFEEDVPNNIKTIRGAYINAFYDNHSLHYEESYKGFPTYSQSILNIIDTQGIKLYLQDEEFSIFDGKVIDYIRFVDLKKGVVTRKIHWQSPQGKEVIITIERLTSFHTLEAFIINYSVSSINFTGEIKFVSTVNGSVSNWHDADDPRVGSKKEKNLIALEVGNKNGISYIHSKTRNSGLTTAASVSHQTSLQSQKELNKETELISESITSYLKQNDTLTMTKTCIYTDSRRHKNVLEENIEINNRVTLNGFGFYKQEQEKFLTEFWNHSDIIVEEDPDLQKGLRFNIYQLLQSCGKDKYSNIPAKGLSGEGYEGHYFWDTEIYMFPFFLFTNPEFAKNLLLFRYSILDASRKIAKDLSHPKGALFAWRTINGDECSAYYPSGTAQYHINTDIAYAVMQYYSVTDDKKFMAEYGAEILFETARVMHDAGNYRTSDGKFVINEVTGPDEYSCCVNNNYYTNLSTKHLFKNTDIVWTLLNNEFKKNLKNLKSKIGISEDEINDFVKAGEAIYLPFDEKLRIHPQDETFLDRKLWNKTDSPLNKLPLLLHYHPLTMYRYQVCKQPDVILGHFLLEGKTDIDVIKNDFDYYENITTHDSSLSSCIFGIMASRIGDPERAYDFFIDTVRLDLDNLQGNTHQGIHCACLGGTWMSMIFGFAGMRIIENELYFRPELPEKMKNLKFKIKYKGRELEISVSKENTDIQLLSGSPMQLYLHDKKIMLNN